MKKILSAVFVMFLVFSFSACDTPTNPKPAPVSLEEGRSIMYEYGRIGFMGIEFAMSAEDPESIVWPVLEGFTVETQVDGSNATIVIKFSNVSDPSGESNLILNGELTNIIVVEDTIINFTLNGTLSISGGVKHSIKYNVNFTIDSEEDYNGMSVSGTVTINGTVFDVLDLMMPPE